MNTFEAVGVFKANLTHSNTHYRIAAPRNLLETLFVVKVTWMG